MNNLPLANWLSVSVRIYRALLVAYPKKFREHYETQLVQVFRDSFKDAYHQNGMTGVIDLWLHTCADLLVTALMERISEGSQYIISPKVILWGGLASVFGGLFWLMMGLAPSSGGPTFMLALVLGLGGLAGLYSRQSGQGGSLGLAGFALGIIGTGLALATLWWGFTTGRLSPSTLQTQPALAAPTVFILLLALATLSIGLSLLGITSLRAETLHHLRGLPLGVGLLSAVNGMTFWLVYYVPLSQGRNPWEQWPPEGYIFNVTALVLLGLGWMGLGITLATEAEARLASPTASAETR
jgi:hypothetical protein